MFENRARFDAGGAARTTRRLEVLLVLLAAIFFARNAYAQQDELDQGKVYAIQKRQYRMNHEFAVSAAFLPLDAFYKFFAVSGHYVLHFNEMWAWEAVHVSFAKYLAIDTGLKKELSDNWDVSATDTPKLDYFLDTDLMLKPLYGKMALFGRQVVHMQTYFLVGLGAVKYETAWFPAVDVGAGLRAFLTNTISLRVEARHYVAVNVGEGGVENALYFGVSFCYNAFADETVDGSKVGR
ncbi:MAG: outer membrane beta-barrel domain-containing protein [Deltaproteobacteria bacterium]|nr:MAG: outer membrane beta-barrel domain-containing protein [Deltaproteobacteria bacterium]